MSIIKNVLQNGDDTELHVICTECGRHIRIREDDAFCPLCFREIEQLNINAWEEYDRDYQD